MGILKKNMSAKIVIFVTVLALCYVTALSALIFVGDMKLCMFGKTEQLMQRELYRQQADERAMRLVEAAVEGESFDKPALPQKANGTLLKESILLPLQDKMMSKSWGTYVSLLVMMAISPALLLCWN